MKFRPSATASRSPTAAMFLLVLDSMLDNAFGDLTGSFTNLLGGDILGVTGVDGPPSSVTYFYPAYVPETTTNVIVASLFDSIFGDPINDSSSATAIVVQASIACTLCATSPDDKNDTPCSVLLLADGSSHTINYDITISNTG